MKDIEEQVRSIAQQISTGEYDFDPEYSDDDEPSAFDYLRDALDIQYIVDGSAQYLGARVLVSFGGPNIWINTQTNTVEGYWWSDQAFASFTDELGLDDCLSEFWACQA